MNKKPVTFAQAPVLNQYQLVTGKAGVVTGYINLDTVESVRDDPDGSGGSMVEFQSGRIILTVEDPYTILFT